MDDTRHPRDPAAGPAGHRERPDPAADRARFAGAEPAHRALTARAARLYRLLALHPAPPGRYGAAEFTVPVAAAALGTAPGDAARLLAELTAARLLTRDAGGGRYRMHRLIREHAAAAAAREETAAARTAAVRRMLEAYARLAAAASASPDDALLREEAENLTAAVRAAEELGLDGLVVRLCDALGPAYARGWYPWECVDTHLRGAPAARRCGDPAAEARIRVRLGGALAAVGRLDEAEGHLLAAARLARADGTPEGEAAAVRGLADLRRRQGRPEDAAALLAAAEECSRRGESAGPAGR
ncbi:hypothetical protein GCM10027168_62240 [Streptomyces capparidis]